MDVLWGICRAAEQGDEGDKAWSTSEPCSLSPVFARQSGSVENLMASGDSGRTWFPELVDELRESWRPDLSWEAIIHLRDRLQAMVEEIIARAESSVRGIGAPIGVTLDQKRHR
jgi:hypothetical protein